MSQDLTLNNGLTMPTLGLGTWKSAVGVVGEAVTHALDLGYRHIDCAAIYGNEPEIGTAFAKAFSKTGIQRKDVFITSKLWNTNHHPDNVEAACRQTLADLQLEYLDLYLIHWGIAFIHGSESEPVDDKGMVITEPVPIQATWKAMESLVEKGLVKSIGISNFTTPMILDLLSYAHIKPVVNQIEVHPYNAQPQLIEYCRKKEIVVTAYSPLGSAGNTTDKPLADPIITAIATDYKKTPAQILIRWSLQRGLIVIPKTVTPVRIAENLNVFDFELSESEMARINGLNKNHRFVEPSQWWGVPYFT